MMYRGLISIEKLYGAVHNNEYVYVELEGEVHNINVAKQPIVDVSKQSAAYENALTIPERIIMDTLNIAYMFSVVGTIIDEGYAKAGIDKSASTITADYSDSATTIVGTDLSGFPEKFGLVKIDEEFIHYITRSTNTLTIPSYGRGYGNSQATYHNSGAAITDYSESAIYKAIKLENFIMRGGLCQVNVKEKTYGDYKCTQTAATKVHGYITPTATSIQLTAVTGLSASGIVKIEDELVYYSGITTVTLTGCRRGYCGSTAAGHTNSNVIGTISENPRTDKVVNGQSKQWGCMMTKFQPQIHRKSHQGTSVDFDAFDVELGFIFGRAP